MKQVQYMMMVTDVHTDYEYIKKSLQETTDTSAHTGICIELGEKWKKKLKWKKTFYQSNCMNFRKCRRWRKISHSAEM